MSLKRLCSLLDSLFSRSLTWSVHTCAHLTNFNKSLIYNMYDRYMCRWALGSVYSYLTSPHILLLTLTRTKENSRGKVAACIDIGTLVGVHTILELWAWLTPLLQTSHTIFISPSNNFSPQLSVSEWKRTDSHDKCLVKSGECSHVTKKRLSLIWCINLITGMGGRELSMEYKWIRKRRRRKNPTLSSVETRHPHVQQVTRTSCQSKSQKCSFFSLKGNHDLQISLKADFKSIFVLDQWFWGISPFFCFLPHVINLVLSQIFCCHTLLHIFAKR